MKRVFEDEVIAWFEGERFSVVAIALLVDRMVIFDGWRRTESREVMLPAGVSGGDVTLVMGGSSILTKSGDVWRWFENDVWQEGKVVIPRGWQQPMRLTKPRKKKA
jgi:hypothetical protein